MGVKVFLFTIICFLFISKRNNFNTFQDIIKWFMKIINNNLTKYDYTYAFTNKYKINNQLCNIILIKNNEQKKL